MGGFRFGRFGAAGDALLASGEFLREMQEQLAIRLGGFAEEAAELVQEHGVLAAVAESVAGLEVGTSGKSGRLVAVVQDLIKRDFESGGEFFKSFEGRNSVAIFHAGEVRAEQAAARFDIALRKLLGFPKFPEAVADDHGRDYSIGWQKK